MVGPLDRGWPRLARAEVKVGGRITGGVIAVDADRGRVRLSIAAAANRELWHFLSRLRPGEVALDDGPGHPVFPGVGFTSMAELSWHHFNSAAEVVQVGQRVSCKFLQFDTSNGEARLSLKAVAHSARRG